jgi:hypothetical protein
VRHALLLGLVASSVLAIGGAASAATTINYTSFQADPNAGEAIVTDFETPTNPGLLSQVIFNMSGYALSGDAELMTGSITGVSAAPAMNATTRDPTQYLSIEEGQSADLTTPLLSTISFYVGSLDGFNGLTFTHQDGTSETFMGTAIDSLLTTVDASGNQVAANSNGRLSFTFSDPITGVHFTSASDSFEISNVATTLALLPETSAWAMMLIGFGGIGAVLRKRRADQTAAA